MIRLLFAFLLVVHGLIHLIGFTQAWGLSRLAEFSGKTIFPLGEQASKAVGLLWLVTCLAFLAAAGSFLLKRESWWMIALPVAVVSQLLVILYWPDAKAGTAANLLILLVAAVSLANWRFEESARAEAQTLLEQEADAPASRLVTTEMLSELPPVVRTWLERANVVGKPFIHTVRLKQRGLMRTKSDGNWMPVEAEQYFTVDQPGFVWKTQVRMAPLLEMTGRDLYRDGHGNMTIKLLSLVPVADARGNEVDQGTLLRYLSEIIWFPTAALHPYLRWEALDGRSARATMSYGSVTASGTFHFNEAGDVAGFEARRYMEQNGNYSLETWTTRGDTFKTLSGGIRIPTEGAATWKLKSGDFTWFKLTIEALDYNRPVLY
ncbi:DUF6544 family protein [Tellurirhabdus rosea]|uniref:DUF6544 family protein n=1 Tax=Tellurirhabdus rosea TaxID=2674997 RepID=UPI0022521B8C|nr:DUF6544 family protein [Tellurirhabdus rosea]